MLILENKYFKNLYGAAKSSDWDARISGSIRMAGQIFATSANIANIQEEEGFIYFITVCERDTLTYPFQSHEIERAQY